MQVRPVGPVARGVAGRTVGDDEFDFAAAGGGRQRHLERLLAPVSRLPDRAQLPGLYVTHDHEEAFALAERILVMRAGRVVQAGAAAEVWRHPADEWTAAFLGFGPAVDGVRGPEGLATPWGMVPSAAPAERNTSVRVVLRPDAVRLDAAGAVGGRVAHRAFAGDRAELTVEAGGVMIRVRVPDRDAPETGAAIRLAIDDEAVLVYPRD